MITQKEIKEAFHYSPRNGKIWRRNKYYSSLITTEGNHGYLMLGYKYKRYLAHRFIWFLYYGKWPKDQLDHINHDKADNRIENLREVNNAENSRNMSLAKNNTSGINGVDWHKQKDRWRVRVYINNIQTHIALCETLPCAKFLRRIADIKYGYHENHGR